MKPRNQHLGKRRRPSVAVHGVQLGFEKLLDEAPNARAHPSFQGIEPIIAKKMSSFGGTDR